MTINRALTLEEFRAQELRGIPLATGELSRLLRDIALAAKRVNVEVNKAGLVDILGDAGAVNVHGELVKKLDLFADNQFIAVLKRGTSCAGVASEERDDFIAFDEALSSQSKYVCVLDPLDGSSNIDVNVSIGTIIGIYRRVSPIGTACTLEDFLQKGEQQVAAGYIIYGSSTMLVYATRRGVNGFTLDPSIGEFTLSHPNILSPQSGKMYSVNHGNFLQYQKEVQNYIGSCQQGTRIMEAHSPKGIPAALWLIFIVICSREEYFCTLLQAPIPKESCGWCMNAIPLHLLWKLAVVGQPMGSTVFLPFNQKAYINELLSLLAVKI